MLKTILRSSIICCCFFWWNVNFFCFLCFYLLIYLLKEFYQLFYFKSPVASAVFWTTHLEADFAAFIPIFVAVFITFFTIFITCKWQKAISFNVFSKLWFCWLSHFYNVYPIISAKLTFSSVSNALLAWSVNQTSTEEDSVLTVFVKEHGKIFIACPNWLFGTTVNKTFDLYG